MTPDKALEHATTVYHRLMQQGRAEAEARADAERWVEGNFGISVTLPVKLAPCGHVPFGEVCPFEYRDPPATGYRMTWTPTGIRITFEGVATDIDWAAGDDGEDLEPHTPPTIEDYEHPNCRPEWPQKPLFTDEEIAVSSDVKQVFDDLDAGILTDAEADRRIDDLLRRIDHS